MLGPMEVTPHKQPVLERASAAKMPNTAKDVVLEAMKRSSAIGFCAARVQLNVRDAQRTVLFIVLS